MRNADKKNITIYLNDDPSAGIKITPTPLEWKVLACMGYDTYDKAYKFLSEDAHESAEDHMYPSFMAMKYDYENCLYEILEAIAAGRILREEILSGNLKNVEISW